MATQILGIESVWMAADIIRKITIGITKFKQWALKSGTAEKCSPTTNTKRVVVTRKDAEEVMQI